MLVVPFGVVPSGRGSPPYTYITHSPRGAESETFMARITLADLSAKLDTIVVALDNHTERIAALESALTPARTASTKSKKAVAPKSIVSSAKQTTSIRKSASKQAQATTERTYTDVAFVATTDAKRMAIALEGENGYLNKAARAYLRVRVLQNARWNGEAVAYLFPDKASYNAAVKRVNALKGIVKQSEIAKFVANGWA